MEEGEQERESASGVLPSHSPSGLISLTHTFKDHHYATLPTGPGGGVTKLVSWPISPETFSMLLHPEPTTWESGRRSDSEVVKKIQVPDSALPLTNAAALNQALDHRASVSLICK